MMVRTFYFPSKTSNKAFSCAGIVEKKKAVKGRILSRTMANLEIDDDNNKEKNKAARPKGMGETEASSKLLTVPIETNEGRQEVREHLSCNFH